MHIAVVSAHELSPETPAIARELSRGHRVTVYTRRYSPELRDRGRLAPGVTVEHVPAGPATRLPESGLLPYLSDFSAGLQERWDRERPDVIHAHSWTSGLAAIAGAEAARGTGAPRRPTRSAGGTRRRRTRPGRAPAAAPTPASASAWNVPSAAAPTR